MQKSKPHRILTEDPSGFFEDSWEGAKRLARNMYNEPVTQAMRIDPIATMSELGQMGWETAKEAPGNLYRYAQENPQELWGNAVEAGATRAMGPASIVRYMAMQPTAANEGEDQLTAAIQRRMAEQGKHSLAEVEPGSLAAEGEYVKAHGGVVEHALRMLRHHYATDGFVDPRLAEDERKKQEYQQAIDVAKQIKAIDAGGPTTAGSQPATTEDMATAINAGAARGDNSMFGNKDNADRSGVISGIMDAAKGAGSSIVDAAKGVGNAVVDTAKSGFNAVTNAFTPAQYVDMPLPPSRPSEEEFQAYNSPTVTTATAPAAPVTQSAPAPQYVDMPLPPSRPTEEEFQVYNSPIVTTAAAPVTPSAPAAPAAPAPQATRGITVAEEVPPAQMPTSSPAQSWAGPAPSITGNTVTQFAENPTTSMPMSLGYSAVPQQTAEMPISGLNQMPMSTNVVSDYTYGAPANNPGYGRSEQQQLGIDMVSGKDEITAAQNEADRMGSRGFESNPITGLTDISNYNSPSFTSDPALVGTSEDNKADYGPPGGVEVEGNAPEGTGQEAPSGNSENEGDGGGGAPEGGGGSPDEKRGGRINVKRNDTFVNHALRVSSKFGPATAQDTVKKLKRHGGRTGNPS